MKTWALVQLARPFAPSAFADIAPFFGCASDIFKVFTGALVIGTVLDVISDKAVRKLFSAKLHVVRQDVAMIFRKGKPQRRDDLVPV